nr:hypothetical protein [Endozoicomonas sp.]
MKHYSNAFWGIALLVIGMLWLTTALALAPAGYEIKNKATVTYQDSLGNEYTALSNEAVVTVAEVYSALLEHDQTIASAPGQTVYFSHQLTNNGNTDDRFTLWAGKSPSASANDLSDVKIYLDINGDGQPSSGEPEIFGSEEVPVASGKSVSLIVAASVSASISSDTLSLALIATAAGRPASSATADGLLENIDTITITDGAVLQVSKQVIRHTPGSSTIDGEVTYRLQIKNNGADLDSGGIYDFFPKFIDLTALNTNPTTDARLGNIEIKDAAKLQAELPSGVLLIPENNHASGLYVAITGLKSGASASLEFSVPYSAVEKSLHLFEAGTLMKDKAWVGYGSRDQDRIWELVSESNLTEVTLPQLYGVSAKNHDNTSHEEMVASASAGGVAEFINLITNIGNGQDIFNLEVTNTSFPKGTDFTLWDETGTIPLSDTNVDGKDDTGLLKSLLKPGHQIKIMVRASLPADATPVAGPYKAVLTAVSVTDASFTDSVTEILGKITSANVDLANFAATTDRIVFDGEVTKITDFFQDKASEDFDPVSQVSSVLTRKAGEAAEFGLYIANRSEVSDSFGLSFDVSTAASIKDTNTQWQVTWRHDGIYDKKGNELAAATGAVITSTPLLPAETVMKVIATLELSGAPWGMPAGDYDVRFTASARGSGNTNSTLDKLILTSEYVLAFTPDSEGQVEAGSFIEYQHTLTNNGNIALNVAILPPADFTLPSGWSYSVKKADGTPINTEDSVAGYSTMAPGAEEKVTVRITAEATLPPGSEFVLTLEARGMDVSTGKIMTTAAITDTTRVLSPSEARITSNKTVATVDESTGVYGAFEEVLSTRVAPGKRVVW